MKITHIVLIFIAVLVLVFVWFVRPREISAKNILLTNKGDLTWVQASSSGLFDFTASGLVTSSSFSVVKITDQEYGDNIHVKILVAPTGFFGARTGSFEYKVREFMNVDKRVTIGKEKVEIYPSLNEDIATVLDEKNDAYFTNVMTSVPYPDEIDLLQAIDVNYIEYNEKGVIKIMSEESENIPKFAIFSFEDDYSFLKVGDIYHELSFNFTYDTDWNTAISNLKLLRGLNNNFYIIAPSYAEEFPAYHVLKIDKKNNVTDMHIHTIEYDPDLMYGENFPMVGDVNIVEDKKGITLIGNNRGDLLSLDLVYENESNAPPSDENKFLMESLE